MCSLFGLDVDILREIFNL